MVFGTPTSKTAALTYSGSLATWSGSVAPSSTPSTPAVAPAAGNGPLYTPGTALPCAAVSAAPAAARVSAAAPALLLALLALAF